MHIPLLISLPLLSATGSPTPGSLSGSGTVTDAQGSPVAGIDIYAVLSWFGDSLGSRTVHSVTQAATVTGPDGSFHFHGLPAPRNSLGYCFVAYDPGKWIGWAVCEGDLRARGWSLAPEPDSCTIKALRPGTRKGFVVDTEGRGIEGVSVTPTSIAIPGGSSSIRADYIAAVVKLHPAVTDEHGAYSLGGIPEGARLTPSVARFGYVSQEFAQISNDRTVMAPGGDISGRVVDEHGSGIPGVQVTACSSNGRAVTGSDGSYRIEGLPAGVYSVDPTVYDRLFTIATDLHVVPGGVAASPPIVVREGILLTGRVTDAETGALIKGTRIRGYGRRDGKPIWGCVSNPTDDDGAYRLYVEPGEAVLRCDPGVTGYVADATPLEADIPAAGLTDQDFRLQKALMVTGSVVDEQDRPVANASVRLFQGRQRMNAPVGYTDEKGYFELKFRKEEQPDGG